MGNSKVVLILVGILLSLFLGIYLLFKYGGKGVDTTTKNYMQPITLNVWGVWDSSDDMESFISAYQAQHSFITINYKRLRYDEYEKALIEAFATDRGPDVLALNNTWLEKYRSLGLIAPLPSKITMATPVVQGTIKKEIISQLTTAASITVPQLKKSFVDVVAHDVVLKATDEVAKTTTENIYGLPLSVDTLVMYYNKDLFNNAGITAPPEYWDNDFQQFVKKLTKQDNKAQIIQSGVALGGSSNIERTTDILSALMMQSGAEMMNSYKYATFNQVPPGTNKKIAPGTEALRFFTDFANPAKEVYCWNNQLPNSLDLFAQGKLAMLFGYNYMLPTIRSNGPKINFEISGFPQIKGNPPVNFANYWVYSVSSKIISNPENVAKDKGTFYAKQKQDTAWDFVQFMANENQVKSYLEKTKRPTALRSLVDKQKEDEKIGIFADQLLTAKSWYKGTDAITAEDFMKNMIDEINSGKTVVESAINKCASKITQIEKQSEN